MDAALVHDPWPGVEARLDLLQAMRTLTPAKRRVLDMHLAGYTDAEISTHIYRGRVAPGSIGHLIHGCFSYYGYSRTGYNARSRHCILLRLMRALDSGPAVFRTMLDEVYEQSKEGRARRSEVEELIRAELDRKRKARELKRAQADARAEAKRKRERIGAVPPRNRTLMYAESHCCLWGDYRAAMERLGSSECFGWWLVQPIPVPMRYSSPPSFSAKDF